MKLQYLCCVFIIAFVEYVHCLRRCSSQNDCDVYFECCSRKMGTKEAFCVKRRQLNDVCLDGPYKDVLINGVYQITCPCQYGFECLKDAVEDDKGKVKYSNPHCRVTTYDPTITNYPGLAVPPQFPFYAYFR